MYPVRYAVACPAGAAGVPALSGNFKIIQAPADIGAARYTLRPLRNGYLYTFDEKRQRLKGRPFRRRRQCAAQGFFLQQCRHRRRKAPASPCISVCAIRNKNSRRIRPPPRQCRPGGRMKRKSAHGGS
ncbi:MAG TPA: toxin VasX [Janthinobacterium sp.]|nr:toxin VasX [Janthinobacterium sp.]